MSLETMTKLQTVTVGAGGVGSIAFSNIPQGYTDLKLAISIRSSTNANPSFYLVVNGNSDNVYSIRRLLGTGSAALSSTLSTTFFRLDGGSNGTGETASTFSSIDIYCPNYSGNTFKTFSFESVVESNTTLVNSYLASGLWSNPSPVTSLTVVIDGTIAQHSTATLYGVKNARQTAGNSIKATGGQISFDGTYVTHTFTSSGTFTPTQPILADYLVVAGGGGGGVNNGGGGGAGGLRSTVTATGGGGALESALSLAPSTAYTVTVGAGGNGGPGTSPVSGSSGSNSVFSTITSTGGGGGGGGGLVGLSGGSGGGGGNGTFAGGAASPSGQGYAGGSTSSSNSPNFGSAGGGGAGAVGQSVSSGSSSPGNGGIGVATLITGTSTYFAGGGGGGANGGTVSTGGSGGGGNGAVSSSGANGTAGTANTGGGGGGSGGPSNGGSGGSGVVIIRYKG